MKQPANRQAGNFNPDLKPLKRGRQEVDGSDVYQMDKYGDSNYGGDSAVDDQRYAQY